MRIPKFPNILFYGPAGVGKSKLVELTYKRFQIELWANTRLITTTPGQLKNLRVVNDLMKRIAQMQKDGTYVFLFIDEIHGLSHNSLVEEALYSAMQDGEYHILEDGKDTVLKLPLLTFAGATTNPALLSEPLRHRFQIEVELFTYSEEELQQQPLNTTHWDQYIGQNHAKQLIEYYIQAIKLSIEEGDLDIVITPEANSYASQYKFTDGRARKRLRLLKLAIIRAMAENRRDAGGNILVLREDVDEVRKLLGIDEDGLTNAHRRVLQFLASIPPHYKARQDTVINICKLTKDEYRQDIQPKLIENGWLETRGGQALTELGKEYCQLRGWLKTLLQPDEKMIQDENDISDFEQFLEKLTGEKDDKDAD